MAPTRPQGSRPQQRRHSAKSAKERRRAGASHNIVPSPRSPPQAQAAKKRKRGAEAAADAAATAGGEVGAAAAEAAGGEAIYVGRALDALQSLFEADAAAAADGVCLSGALVAPWLPRLLAAFAAAHSHLPRRRSTSRSL